MDTTVVHLFSKPHVKLPAGDALGPALSVELDRYAKLDLPLSVNFDGRVLARLLRTQ